MPSLAWRRTLLLVVGAVVLMLGSRIPTGSKLHADAAETLQMAFNLERHGVISLEPQPPFAPSMYREPIPILTTAAMLGIGDFVFGTADQTQYREGNRARFLKYQDLFWVLVMYLAAFFAIGLFSNSYSLRLFGAVFVCLPYLTGARNAGASLDYMYSDLAAGAALLLASTVFVHGVVRQKTYLSVAAGICFGVFALTKAAGLYIFVGTVCVLILYSLNVRRAVPLAQGMRQVALLVLAFIVALAPWIYRNHHHFDTYRITERGGVVLMTRALKNLMTAEEYLGTFYVWAPDGRLQFVVGRLLGFSSTDLLLGGRLQRLNRSNSSTFAQRERAAVQAGKPENVISYFRKAAAEHRKVELQYATSGHPSPSAAADRDMQQRAVTLIKSHPLQHLAMTIPCLWRGALFSFPLLLGALALGLWNRNHRLVLFVLPALGLVMFYALLSHFILRYGKPVMPVTLVSAIAIASILWELHVNREARLSSSTDAAKT